jgi:hypothetical protein
MVSLRLYTWLIPDSAKDRIFSVVLISLPLATVALVFSPFTALLGACLVLLGVFSAILQVESNSRAHKIEERTGSHIFASCHGYFSAGVIAAGLCALVAEQLDYGVWVFCISMAITAFTALLVFRPGSFRNNGNWVRGPKEDKPDLYSFPRFGLVSLTVMGAAVLFVESAVNTWHSTFVNEASGMRGYSGASYVAYALGGLLIRFSGDRMRQKFGIFSVFALLGPLSTVFLLAAVYLGRISVILLALLLLGAAMGIAYPDILKIAAISESDGSANRISVVATGSAAGSLLANPTVGLISGIYSVQIAFVFIALLVGVTACYAALALIRWRSGRS